MLLYIGVGLAVTTMCIDLVGIHYLQKIHYFGRKFKGYDLLKLLRQRRMIERRMAMAAQAADIMQMYFDAVDRYLLSARRTPRQHTRVALSPFLEACPRHQWFLNTLWNKSFQYTNP